MDELHNWESNNSAYLSAALGWLHLRLERLAGAPEDEDGAPRVDRAEDILLATEQASPPPAMHLLAGQLGLSRFEQEILLLCAAMEYDTRIPTLCARAQGDLNRAYPTFALAMALFELTNLGCADPGSPAALLAAAGSQPGGGRTAHGGSPARR